MAKFDRYLVSQLMMLFGFFALVLVMIYWVNRAVLLFDQLIANGHSALVFLEFSALTLPNVVRLVLPIATFAAAVYSANRLASDSELVVVQSTGFSPYRLARPVLVFGIIVGLLLSIITHFLVPLSLIQLAERRVEIESDSTARFLQEGTFLHPVDGVTFYVKEISADGAMASMFLSDSRNENHETSFSAKQAVIVVDEIGPKLIMLNGMVQDLDTSSQTLTTTQFSEFVLDLSGLVDRAKGKGLPPAQLPTLTLLKASPADIKLAGSSRAIMLYTGHERIAQGVFCVVLALIGFSTLLLGSFSRFGLWRQIMGALLIFIILKTLDNLFGDIARNNANLWPMAYGAPALGLACAYCLLWLSDQPSLFTKRRWKHS
ncbi:MAG: LPS export ABC transporter permease LptF [Paracoccaceae bacterium]